jgi:acyl-CoA thioesterase 8
MSYPEIPGGPAPQEVQTFRKLVSSEGISESLLELLELETVDDGGETGVASVFRSVRLYRPIAQRGVFGGQVAGLALAAANRTVRDLTVNSLHSYFILAGDAEVSTIRWSRCAEFCTALTSYEHFLNFAQVPIVFNVSKTRDGRSFALREVNAMQHGKSIFRAFVSYHNNESSPLAHQFKMPDAPAPESVPSVQEAIRSALADDSNKLDPSIRAFLELRLSQPFPVDIRKCTPSTRKPRAPKELFWIKATLPLPAFPTLNSSSQENSDDLRRQHVAATSQHCAAAAYCSDHSLVATAALPLGYPNSRVSFMASLDHS